MDFLDFKNQAFLSIWPKNLQKEAIFGEPRGFAAQKDPEGGYFILDNFSPRLTNGYYT